MKTKIISLLLCIVLLCLSLVSCTQTAHEISGESDLVNLKIGVIESSTSDRVSQKYAENGCEILKYSSVNKLRAALESKEITCAIIDENIANAIIKEDNSFEIKGEPLAQDSIAFCATNDKKFYRVLFNKALAELKESGKLDEIINGYLSDPDYKYEYVTEGEANNGTITIALDSTLIPYVYPRDEKHEIPEGIYLALIDSLCASIGFKYSFATLTTSSLAGALRMGLADLAIGSFDLANPTSGTDTIEQTDPILSFNHIILVKK